MPMTNSRRAFLLTTLALAMGSGAIAQQTPTKPLPPGRVEIQLEDLHCSSCAKKVARKLYALKGVRKVKGYIKADLVVVLVPTNQTIDPKAIWKAALAGGVKPVELRYADQRLNAEHLGLVESTAALPKVNH